MPKKSIMIPENSRILDRKQLKSVFGGEESTTLPIKVRKNPFDSEIEEY